MRILREFDEVRLVFYCDCGLSNPNDGIYFIHRQSFYYENARLGYMTTMVGSNSKSSELNLNVTVF